MSILRFHRAGLGCVAIVALASACADDSVVGENDGPGMNPGRAPDSTASCEERRTLPALPATEVNYSEGPAAWLEAASGTWSNAQGDTLEIAFDQASTRVEWICDGNSIVPGPAGPRPYISFELTGELALHTADGAWDERVTATYSLAPGPAGTPFSMMLRGGGSVSVSTMHGTFAFPSDLPVTPSDTVSLTAEYQSGGWALHRSAARATRSKCLCGDLAPAWEGEQLVFVRR